MLKCTYNQNGTREWFLDGTTIRHRENAPAIESDNGLGIWYINGKLHRLDGPAVEYEEGSKEWFVNGKRHRADGPAVK